MILKASQRGSGANLAAHLMKLDDNEHIQIYELRGFASNDLHGAFKEAEAISLGTKCKQYLFSVSLNPPEGENVSIEIFEDALDRIEGRLGLTDQPRAVVFHEKENRLHAHAVWSRIDAETMTAKQLSFFKTKLMGISRDLYLENGWDMPNGIAKLGNRNPEKFSLAEWQQCKRQGIDPRLLKSTVQACWSNSDNLKAFQSSLTEIGFLHAKGDKRGHVILDHNGEVYSLPRMLGVRAKDVRARLGDGHDLKSVDASRKLLAERMTPAIRALIAESKQKFQSRSDKLNSYKKEMTELHRKARTKLAARQKSEWDTETIQRSKRLPKGLKGLWFRLTGKYRTISKTNNTEAHATRARHGAEQQELVEKQRSQRAILQTRIKELRRDQAKQLRELRKDIGRYLKFARGNRAPNRSRGSSLGLKLSR